MQFKNIYVLFLTFLVPIFFILLIMGKKFLKVQFKKFAELKFLDYYFPAHYSTVWIFKNLLLVGAIFFLIISLSRPQWGKGVQKVKQQGIDIAICIDVSKSMDATDISLSRLLRGKDLIYLFTGMLKGDRVALIPFAGVAKISCPLTSDYGTFGLFIDLLNTDFIKQYGTNIGHALTLADRILQNEQKIVLLISDGEDLDGNVVDIASKLAKKGIRIYSVGVGTPLGSAIINKTGDGKYIKDDKGNIVQSRLDMQVLEEISTLTGGKAYSITPNQAEIFEILGDITMLEKNKFQTKFNNAYKERYFYFAFVALFLLALESFIFSKNKENGDRFLE